MNIDNAWSKIVAVCKKSEDQEIKQALVIIMDHMMDNQRKLAQQAEELTNSRAHLQSIAESLASLNQRYSKSINAQVEP